MSDKVLIQFGLSKSLQFKEVVKTAKKFPTYFESEGKHNISLDSITILTQWELFNKIFVTIWKWASFDLFINEKMIPKDQIHTFFYKIQEVKNCYNNYLTLENPDLYCNSSGWGCIKISAINLKPSDYINLWYEYGHFSNDYSKWILHKKDILNVIIKETKDDILYNCPVFMFQKIINVVESIPSEITLPAKGWKVVYANVFQGQNIVKKPIGIRHVIDIDYENESSDNPFEYGSDDWTKWILNNE